MKSFGSFIVAGGLVLAANAVQAMPIASAVGTAAETPLTLVAGGCGFGEHRGRFGGCRLNNGPRGALRAMVSGAPRGCPPGKIRGPRGFCHY